MDGNRHGINPSLSVHKSVDNGFVSSSPFQTNPFIVDENEGLDIMQQQYLNIKR